MKTSFPVLVVSALFFVAGLFLNYNPTPPVYTNPSVIYIGDDIEDRVPAAIQPEESIATTSFSYACTSGPDASCDHGKLGDVLRIRAAQPDYKRYEDVSTGVSFEYPSSISTVERHFYPGQSGRFEDQITYFFIYPIRPAPVHTETWFGASVSIGPCVKLCLTDFPAYLIEMNRPYLGDEVSSFEIISKNTVIENQSWVKARITYPIGSSEIWYAAVKDGNKIMFISDVEDWGPEVDPLIYPAFHHIIETLKF